MIHGLKSINRFLEHIRRASVHPGADWNRAGLFRRTCSCCPTCSRQQAG